MAVEGNKFEFAAVHGLLALFESNDFHRIQSGLGLLRKDIKAALVTAMRQTMKWGEREGAKQFAAATGVPYRVMRERIRIKYRYQSIKGEYPEGRVWFGLNPISLKHLGAKVTKTKGVTSRFGKYPKGFYSQKMGGHFYERRGRDALPLQRLEYGIAEIGDSVVNEFKDSLSAKYMENFFSAIDKIKGREKGASAEIMGASLSNVTKFGR
jgi:hypothetical protein